MKPAVSNQRIRHTDGGANIQFTLARSKDGQVGIEQIGYHLHWVWVYTDEDRTHYQLLPVQMLETVTKFMPDSHKEQCERFIRDERKLYQNHNLSVPEFIYNEQDKTYFLLAPLQSQGSCHSEIMRKQKRPEHAEHSAIHN